MTFLKGWRTTIFNFAVIVASFAEYMEIISVASPQNAPLIILAIGIANMVLRYMTTTPIASKT